jgi:hypothetical protein
MNDKKEKEGTFLPLLLIVINNYLSLITINNPFIYLLFLNLQQIKVENISFVYTLHMFKNDNVIIFSND